MEQILNSGTMGIVGAVGVVVIVALVVGFVVMRAGIKVAGPDEALIISGKTQKEDDGTVYPTSVIVNGSSFVNPVMHRHYLVPLKSRQVSMNIEAQTNDGIMVELVAVAQVKVSSERRDVRKAAERFASEDKNIVAFTQDQLEGELRGVVAMQTAIQLRDNRSKLAEEIATSIIPNLAGQGLLLDSFSIRTINDKEGYYDSLGEAEIQGKRQVAEIAKTDAERAIAKQRLLTEEANLIEQTAFDKNSADAASEVGRARAQAEQAEALAREEARQRVLQQQAENKQAQLDSDVRRVADAERYKREQEAEANAFEETRQAEVRAAVAESEAAAVRAAAEAEADALRAMGTAKADAIRAEADALVVNQQALLAQRALEILPQLVEAHAMGYASIGKVTVLAAGDSSSAASQHFSGEQAAGLSSVLESVQAMTGIDLGAVIQGRATGAAAGAALAEAEAKAEQA